jgi:hypothetical protein
VRIIPKNLGKYRGGTFNLTDLDTLTKLDLSLNTNALKEAIYGLDSGIRLHNRKLHLRGFTNAKQLANVSRIAGSKKKASKILISFTERFWECFYERLWKFRCEIMVEWEKENGISVKEKRKKRKKQQNKNKENIRPEVLEKETKAEKEARVQKEASGGVDR